MKGGASNFSLSKYTFPIYDVRSDIGLLMWQKDEEETSKLNMGSRYKTPNLPVWVSCVNGNWGVLFSPNKDLLKSENRWEDKVSFGSNY